jgi:hypothetical protein
MVHANHARVTIPDDLIRIPVRLLEPPVVRLARFEAAGMNNTTRSWKLSAALGDSDAFKSIKGLGKPFAKPFKLGVIHNLTPQQLPKAKHALDVLVHSFVNSVFVQRGRTSVILHLFGLPLACMRVWIELSAHSTIAM